MFYSNTEKYRNELKYVCSDMELELIESRIKALCKKDIHVGKNGVYSIRSIYFDDPEDTCYFQNENGIDPREKFRIRVYNKDSNYILLECKKKKSNMCHKDSCVLSKYQFEKIMSCEYNELYNGGVCDSLLERFLTLKQIRGFMPKIIVDYERTPYVYSVGNVRITFDRNIAASLAYENFFEDIDLRPIMPVGKQVLEVKYDELLPDFLYRALNIPNLTRSAFSKYYLCRKYIGGDK